MIFCLIVAVLAVVLDQVSKYLIGVHLVGVESFPQDFDSAVVLSRASESVPVIDKVLNFTFIPNEGAAFGMLSEHRWVFMVLSVVGIIALVVWLALSKVKSRWMQCAIALVVGGGIGNMIDRVRLEYVIDFIDCRFIDFYVFNIADSCVCVGCAMVMLSVILDEVKEKKNRKAALNNAANDNEGSDE